MPGLYEQFGLHAKLLRDGDEVRLMRFQEANEGREQRRLTGPSPKLVCPDSGQLEEALGPAGIAKRCR